MNSVVIDLDLQRRLLTKICYLYYEKNLTQQEISRQTGLSRIKVSRMIQKAKDIGIVKVVIDFNGSFLEKEIELSNKYNLKNTIIIDSDIDSNTKSLVAAAAAYFLENNLLDNSTVAVGWGSTLRLIQDYLNPIDKNILFSPIIGGHGKNEFDLHASSIAASMAKKTNCKSLSLLAPAFIQNIEEKEIYLKDKLTQEVLAKSAAAEYAIFSLGNPLHHESTLNNSGYFSDEDIKLLHKESSICDIVSIVFLNNKCEPCCESISDRSIGIKTEELKKIPNKICVVEGASKYLTVKTALQAGYIDILILDNKMAEFLI